MSSTFLPASHTGSPPTSSASQHSSPATVDLTYEQFGFLTYIIFGSVLGLFTLFSIPHVVARFSSEPWPARHGFFLRFSSPKTRDPLTREPSGRRTDSSRSHYGSSEKSPREADLHRIAMYNMARRPRLFPSHFPSWNTIFYPLSHFTSARVPLFSKYSVAQGIVLVGYATMIAITVLLFNNPVSQPLRAGWIA